MPAGSTRRVPGVSSGALYRRSTPRTRSSVAFGTLPDETLPDGTLSGRVAAAAEPHERDDRPGGAGSVVRERGERPRGRGARPPLEGPLGTSTLQVPRNDITDGRTTRRTASAASDHRKTGT